MLSLLSLILKNEKVILAGIFMFTSTWEMIQFDEHVFQMGWNHQLVLLYFAQGCIIPSLSYHRLW